MGRAPAITPPLEGQQGHPCVLPGVAWGVGSSPCDLPQHSFHGLTSLTGESVSERVRPS